MTIKPMTILYLTLALCGASAHVAWKAGVPAPADGVLATELSKLAAAYKELAPGGE